MSTPAPTWTEGWHFATVNRAGHLAERYGSRRRIVVGKRLSVRGTPVPCECGMHASVRAYDALRYAVDNGQGIAASRAILDGAIAYQSDKAAAAGRTALWVLSPAATEAVLRAFARRCALDVLPLWRDLAPEVVTRYLETGDESLRDAAWDAAWAARAAAVAAAQAASWAAWAAASNAAMAAASNAAMAAAWAAASNAAMAAAWADATAAATAAARGEKIETYNGWLEDMLTTAAKLEHAR